jgi:hypothetical protein
MGFRSERVCAVAENSDLVRSLPRGLVERVSVIIVGERRHAVSTRHRLLRNSKDVEKAPEVIEEAMLQGCARRIVPAEQSIERGWAARASRALQLDKSKVVR